MTLEEKKAIKELTEIKDLVEEDLEEDYEAFATLDKVDLKSLVTVLNLIQKQEKIIDKMAEVICRLDTFNNYDTWNNDIEETKQYFERQVEENV